MKQLATGFGTAGVYVAVNCKLLIVKLELDVFVTLIRQVQRATLRLSRLTFTAS